MDAHLHAGVHRADQHVDLVALDEPVGVLGCVLGLGLVVELGEGDLAPPELAALLGDQNLDGGGDVLAQLGEGPRVGQHQADLERLRLSDGPTRRHGRDRAQSRRTLDDFPAR